MTKYIPNSILRQIFFILIGILMFILIAYNLVLFIPGFLGAFCLYVLLIHPLRWMMYKWKMHKVLSVILLMLGSILVIITPLYFLIDMLSVQVTEAISSKEQIQSKIEMGLKQVETEFGIDILKEINLGDVSSVVMKIIHQILITSIKVVIQL